MRRSLIIRTTAVAATAALALTACGGGGGSPLSSGSGGSAAPSSTIIVGSANFTENSILAEIYAQALAAKGITVEKKLSIGSREAYYPGLQDGSIDLIPEYTGVLLQYINKAATETSPDDVYAALQKALPPTLVVTDKSAAEDKDAVVVTKETAAKYNAKSIADLAPHCGQITFGGPPEFQTRPDGIPGIAKTYNCTFKDYKSLDAGGPLTIAALKNGDVQAADIFTTDASIQADGFVALEDPKSNFAAQNVVPLINKAKATDAVKQVLNAVSAKLTTDELLTLNSTAAGPTKPAVDVVAKDWLTKNGLL
ncbi:MULTISPECIES: ABC transporter substrate-binding protein [unclassified Pseudonocardia]|jgi:osmoprotectant transport system substrate-binding protein|uniref:ABC transporter substrate-binding protein n=1 Tax=unclassified Pseudonocardia TaxID=2619320 RepID=UPI00095C1F0D|nr:MULTISPECIES: ABC transporter substrate-binding protein [unclassified Pseudonocardia]MBN9097264.1 ABC transporter substrate-binding protein [Pseudonocardia sp.]OJY48838.1 MAG: glycine/betaine ABC transporter substrate-binding protein [Pseudonocardia sp. 73-21]